MNRDGGMDGEMDGGTDCDELFTAFRLLDHGVMDDSQLLPCLIME